MIKIADHNVYIGDCHNHTTFSGPGEHSHPLSMLPGYVNGGFDFVAVTEHYENLIGPADEHYRYMKQVVSDYQLPLTILSGVEREVGWAHLICLGPIEPRLIMGDPDRVVRELRASGAYISVAHPYGLSHRHLLWDSGLLERLVREGRVDAFEVHCGGPDEPVGALYRKLTDEGIPIGLTTGSDAHRKDDARLSRLLVFADDPSEESLLQAIKDRKTVVAERGKLCGPRDLCELLDAENYLEKMKQVEEQRAKIVIDVPEEGACDEKNTAQIKIPSGVDEALVAFPDGEKVSCAAIHGTDSIAYRLPPNPVTQPSAIISVTCATPFGKLAVLKDIRVVERVTADLSTIANGKDRIAVRVLNNTASTLDGSFVLESDLLGETASVSLELPAGAEITHEIPVTLNERSRDLACSAKLSFVSPALSRVIVQRNLSFIRCAKVASFEQILNTPDVIRTPQNGELHYFKDDAKRWKGPEDLSAVLRMAWTDEALLMHFDVIDDKHKNEWSNLEAFWGDSIQFGFDPVLTIEKAYGEIYEFLAARNMEGNYLYRWFMPWKLFGKPKRAGWGQQLGSECCRIEPKPGGMEYWLSIPWKELAPFEPAAGKRFGFSFIVNDADDGRRDKWISWGGNIGWEKDPSNWATITLTK